MIYFRTSQTVDSRVQLCSYDVVYDAQLIFSNRGTGKLKTY